MSNKPLPVLLNRPRLVFLALITLAAALRFSHLDIAHFQLDQARIAQYAWEMAREGVFRSHFFALTGGYSNFPLALYLLAPVFLIASAIHFLLLWMIILNLAALALCWYFARRYWGWPAAAAATLLLACAPWDAFYAHRLWTNSLMPPFVMLWAIGSAFAYHEGRPRYWALSWAAAAWLLQLHAGGIIFLFISGLLSAAARWQRRPFSWRAIALGLALGILPALPWLAAHLSGAAHIDAQRIPFFGAGKRGLVYHWQPLVDFLTARHLLSWFRGAGLAELGAHFAPLDRLAHLALLVHAGAAAFVCWRARSSPRRRLYQLLALWLLLPLSFPFISYDPYTIVYYLPWLPAPFFALAAAVAKMGLRWRWLCAAMLITYGALNANAIWQSARFARAGVARDDPTIWAVGGGAPLSSQLDIASAAQKAHQAGEAAELVIVLRPVYEVEHEMLRYAMPFLAQGVPARFFDARAPQLLYPAQPSLWLIDENQTALPGAYMAADAGADAGPEEIERSTSYRLYRLPGGAGPAAAYPLPEESAYANGLRLLGHDGLRCAGDWHLHWSPGPAPSPPAAASEQAHFFAHLLDEAGDTLAQQDLRAYDTAYWRPHDRLITTFDFGQELSRLPIAAIRVGLYGYSEAEWARTENIYALDEQGRPWRYAIDIPYAEPCLP